MGKAKRLRQQRRAVPPPVGKQQQRPRPAPMRVLVPAHRLATAGLLPERLREEYGLRWTPLHELALPLAARSVKAAATPDLFAAGRMAPLPESLAA